MTKADIHFPRVVIYLLILFVYYNLVPSASVLDTL
jgi:hypothetical protein